MNGKRILIIEDDDVLRRLLLSMLESEGFDAVAVKNETETVLKILDAEPGGFGLALLDMHGSRPGWLHFLKTLRTISCRVPVVAIIGFTMNDGADITSRVMAHGAAGYLTGPLDTENLMTAVKEHFQP